MISNFVTPQGEKNLVAYKYVGSDASLLYKYFFSPCAQFLVDNVIPEWLAPNVITLIGFMCTMIPHVIILYMTGGTLSGYIPPWLCFLAAFGQLAYMILDNADGKQARKTGSSSPLGLLFDHGCDAMNTFVSGLTLFTIIQMGNTGLSSWAYMMPMTAFFMATWEEYYVDGLHLPIINGANEGIVMAIFMFIASGIFGTHIWTDTKLVNIPLNMMIFYSFVFMSVVTILSNIVNVCKKDSSKLCGALFNLVAIIYLNVTIIIATFFSSTNLGQEHARLVIYFVGFCFAKLVGHLQMSHVAHQDFQQFRKSTIFVCTILNASIIITNFTKQGLVDETKLLYGCLAYSIIAYIHFTMSAISQFCRVLRIHAFKLGKRDDEALLDPTQKVEMYNA